MIKQEELFTLIKSLTKSEKRYFKLHSAHGNAMADYVRLFDAIEQQTVYDEAAIKRKFADEKFIKQLHVIKNYLRQQIMSSLRSFHNSLSKDAELKEVLRNVEVLFHKELFKLCDVELKRAERLAIDYEMYISLLEIYNWKRKLSQVTEPHNYNLFNNYVQKQTDVLDVLKNNNSFWKNMILETWKTFSPDTAPKRKPLKTSKAKTLDAKVLDYNTRYIVALREGNSIQGEAELNELIRLLEAYPQRLKEEPASYISTINNLVSYLVFNRRDGEALELINKAKATYNTFKITSEKKSLLKQILRTYSLELEIYRGRGKKRTKKDNEFIATTEQFIEENKNKIPIDYFLSFSFQLASLYFKEQDYDNTLNWLNRILNSKHKTVRPDLHKHGRMLNIMVHFERQNLFVLRYFIDSARRYAKKYTEYRPYEEQLFKFFTTISKAHEYDYRRECKKAYEYFFPEQEESLIPDQTLDYIDYKIWLEKKIKKRNN